MISRMKKVSLVGERKQLKNIIDLLKQTGNFQITFYKSTGTDLSPEDIETRNNINTKINTVSNMLSYVNADSKTIDMEYDELKKVAKKESTINKLIAKLELASIHTNELKAKKTKNHDTILSLTPFEEMPIAASYIKNTRSVFVLAGLISKQDFTKFQNDIDTKEFIIETYPAKHGQSVVVITGDIDNLPIAEAIMDYNYTSFPSNHCFDNTPKAQIEILTKENEELDSKISDITEKAKLSLEEINLLKTYYDYLLNELDTFEILTATMQTKECFIVNGWIPAKLEARFTELVTECSKNIVINIKDAAETDNPPVAVTNSHIVAPYNSITTMYGAPGRTDIDPNPFVAFFYFLFFGMMFGDVAYGILLSLITGFILIFKKPKGGMKQMMGLFLMGGISAAIWGLLFNSFFGLNLPDFILGSTIIDPLRNDSILFFALSLYFGVIQIMVGTLLNFINMLRQKRFTDSFLKALPHFVLFIGLTLSFPSLINSLIPLNYGFMAWFKPLMMPGVIIMLVGLAGIVLFNGIGKKFGGYLISTFSGAYKLVNYFSDILSYARLFGVGLVGCVISSVANSIFNMFAGIGIIGIILGAIVAVIFHSINIGLGLLSTYIHNARLQFVEFFGKFYEGSGTQFAPLGSKLRYTRILGNV